MKLNSKDIEKLKEGIKTEAKETDYDVTSDVEDDILTASYPGNEATKKSKPNDNKK